MLSKRQKKEEVSREYEVTERKCSVPLKGSKVLRIYLSVSNGTFSTPVAFERVIKGIK